MAKLKLIADPTFTAKVGIPVAGADPVPVEFTFKHRTKDAMLEFMTSREGKTDAESLLAMASGWDLEEEFNAENVEVLLQNYMGSALAVYLVYRVQLEQGKLKN